MATLTKTQINYFRERLMAAAAQCKRDMYEESKLMLPDFNPEEAKLKAIITGQVELKEEVMNRGDFGLGTSLRDAYPDPRDVCEFNQKKSALSANIYFSSHRHPLPVGDWPSELDRRVARMLDDFVLGAINSDNVVETIQSVITWRPADYWPLLREAGDKTAALAA